MTQRVQTTILSRDDREFFTILAGCGMGYALLVAALSLVPSPPPSATDVRSLPPRFAKLLLEAPSAPTTTVVPPAPMGARPTPIERPKPAPSPQKPEARPMPPRPEVTPLPARVEEDAATRAAETAAAVREHDRTIAKQSGLLKALTETSGRDPVTGADPGLQRVLSDISILSNPSLQASGHGGVPDTANDGGAGGTLSVDDLVASLKDQGNGGAVILGGQNHTRIESSLAVQGADTTRSIESIRTVTRALDTWLKFKYREALRAQPTLGTSLTVEFTITPPGGVTDCHVASSNLQNPQLENSILKRFCLLRFAPLPEGSDDEVTVKYPIDFEGLS